jgi:CRISPR-associated protein Csb2
MTLGPQPPLEVISGHCLGSTPEAPLRTERPHLALAPLAFAGSPHATGEVLGMAALLPQGLSREERDSVLATLRKVRELDMRFGTWKVACVTADDSRSNLHAEAWARPSQVWATVTPYVFDRYPADPYGDEAQETVRLSFERVGLPRPVSVAIMKESVHIGVPPAPQFPPAVARAGKPRRFHLHVLVTFGSPVGGPMIAGAGRFYGYGLFRRVHGADSD